MSLEVDPVMVAGGYRIIDTTRVQPYQGVAIVVQRDAHPVHLDCQIAHSEALERAAVMAAGPDLLDALQGLMHVVANPKCAEGFALGMARAKATAAIQRATASPMGKE